MIKPRWTGLSRKGLGQAEYMRRMYVLKHGVTRPRWTGLSYMKLGAAEYQKQRRALVRHLVALKALKGPFPRAAARGCHPNRANGGNTPKFNHGRLNAVFHHQRQILPIKAKSPAVRPGVGRVWRG